MIFHLAVRDEWVSAENYRPTSLREDGFIHCSTAPQLIQIANDRFAGRTDLLLVTLEPDLIAVPVVYEDCYDTGRRFPHMYGPINREAVVSVEPFLPDDTGHFSCEASAHG